MCYYFATLEPDEDAENPRNDADLVGTLYTWHPRYTLGGHNDFNHQEPVTHFPAWIFLQFKEFSKLPELKNFSCKAKEIYVNHDYAKIAEIQFFNKTLTTWMKENLCILPLYLTETPHLSLKIEPFSWSPPTIHVGFIYTTRSTCDLHSISFADAKQQLHHEIEVLNQYLKGDMWTFTIYSTEDKNFDQLITQHGENLPNVYTYESSCGGCYGFQRTKDELQHLLAFYQQHLKT